MATNIKILKGSYGHVTILNNNRIIKESKFILCGSILRELYFMNIINNSQIKVDYEPKIKIYNSYLGEPINNVSLKMTYEEKIDIIFQLISEVARIHQLNICHNDLTFNNILVKDNKINIIDWGQACYSCIETKYPIYDKWFRDPEYQIGDKITMCNDLWALGCIIINVMTGKNPIKKYYDKNNIIELNLQNKELEKLIMNIMTNSSNRISAHNMIRNYPNLWKCINKQKIEKQQFKEIYNIRNNEIISFIKLWCKKDNQNDFVYKNTIALYEKLHKINKQQNIPPNLLQYLYLICYYISLSVLGSIKKRFINYNDYIIKDEIMTQSKFIRLAIQIIKSFNFKYIQINIGLDN